MQSGIRSSAGQLGLDLLEAIAADISRGEVRLVPRPSKKSRTKQGPSVRLPDPAEFVDVNRRL